MLKQLLPFVIVVAAAIFVAVDSDALTVIDVVNAAMSVVV